MVLLSEEGQYKLVFNDRNVFERVYERIHEIRRLIRECSPLIIPFEFDCIYIKNESTIDARINVHVQEVIITNLLDLHLKQIKIDDISFITPTCMINQSYVPDSMASFAIKIRRLIDPVIVMFDNYHTFASCFMSIYVQTSDFAQIYIKKQPNSCERPICSDLLIQPPSPEWKQEPIYDSSFSVGTHIPSRDFYEVKFDDREVIPAKATYELSILSFDRKVSRNLIVLDTDNVNSVRLTRLNSHILQSVCRDPGEMFFSAAQTLKNGFNARYSRSLFEKTPTLNTLSVSEVTEMKIIASICPNSRLQSPEIRAFLLEPDVQLPIPQYGYSTMDLLWSDSTKPTFFARIASIITHLTSPEYVLTELLAILSNNSAILNCLQFSSSDPFVTLCNGIGRLFETSLLISFISFLDTMVEWRRKVYFPASLMLESSIFEKLILLVERKYEKNAFSSSDLISTRIVTEPPISELPILIKEVLLSRINGDNEKSCGRLFARIIHNVIRFFEDGFQKTTDALLPQMNHCWSVFNEASTLVTDPKSATSRHIQDMRAAVEVSLKLGTSDPTLMLVSCLMTGLQCGMLWAYVLIAAGYAKDMGVYSSASPVLSGRHVDLVVNLLYMLRSMHTDFSLQYLMDEISTF